MSEHDESVGAIARIKDPWPWVVIALSVGYCYVWVHFHPDLGNSLFNAPIYFVYMFLLLPALFMFGASVDHILGGDLDDAN